MGIRTRETGEYFPKTKSHAQAETESAPSNSNSASASNSTVAPAVSAVEMENVALAATVTEQQQASNDDSRSNINPNPNGDSTSTNGNPTPKKAKSKGKGKGGKKSTPKKKKANANANAKAATITTTTTTKTEVEVKPPSPPPPPPPPLPTTTPTPTPAKQKQKQVKQKTKTVKVEPKPEVEKEKVKAPTKPPPPPVVKASKAKKKKEKAQAQKTVEEKEKVPEKEKPKLPLVEDKVKVKEQPTAVSAVPLPFSAPVPVPVVEEKNQGGNLIKNGIIKANKKMKKGMRTLLERTNKILERSRNCKKSPKKKVKPRPIPARASARLCVRKNSGEHEQGLECNNQPLRTVELIKRPLELRDPATKLLYLASLSLYPKADPESDTTPIVIISEEMPSVGGKKPKLRSMELPLLPNWRNNALYHSTSRTIDIEEPAVLLNMERILSPGPMDIDSDKPMGRKSASKKKSPSPPAPAVKKTDSSKTTENTAAINASKTEPLTEVNSDANPLNSNKRSNAKPKKKGKQTKAPPAPVANKLIPPICQNEVLPAVNVNGIPATKKMAIVQDVPRINGLHIESRADPKLPTGQMKIAGDNLKFPFTSISPSVAISSANSSLTFTGLFSNTATSPGPATTASKTPKNMNTTGFPSIPNVTFTSISYPTFTTSSSNINPYPGISISQSVDNGRASERGAGTDPIVKGNTVNVNPASIKKKRKSLETIIKEIPKAKAQKMDSTNCSILSPPPPSNQIQLPINFSASASSNPILEGLMKNPIKKRSPKAKSEQFVISDNFNNNIQMQNPICMTVPLQPAPELPLPNGQLFMKEPMKPKPNKKQKPQFQLPVPLPIPLPPGLLNYASLMTKNDSGISGNPKPKKPRKQKAKKVLEISQPQPAPQPQPSQMQMTSRLSEQRSPNSYPSLPYLPSHLEAFFKPMVPMMNGLHGHGASELATPSPPLPLAQPDQSQALDLCVKAKAKPAARKRQKKVVDTNIGAKSLLKPLNVEDDTPLNLVVSRTNIQTTTQAKPQPQNSQFDPEPATGGLGQQENLENVKQMLARLHTKIQPAVNGVQLITIE